MKIREGLLKTSPETLATLTQTVESDIEKLKAKLKTAKLSRAQFEAVRLLRKFDLEVGKSYFSSTTMAKKVTLLNEVSEEMGLHFSYDYGNGRCVENILNESYLERVRNGFVKIPE